MKSSSDLINDLAQEYQGIYRQQKVILTFDEFLEQVRANPCRYIRNASEYVLDTIRYFGSRESSTMSSLGQKRFKLFDLGTEKNGPIVGGENVQQEIHNILNAFVNQGFASKLILLHGPNGSAKSSTIDTLAHGMQRYSETDEGVVYRFNWIFPSDKDAMPTGRSESVIGFGSSRNQSSSNDSFALLDEKKIASKVTSEFKENPIFLLPKDTRIKWLKEWIAAKDNKPAEDVELPPHIYMSSLSKRNQEIFENLLNAYDGNLNLVYRHVQVERFFYSKQYRVGISTVEPQMTIDAQEKQLTLDKNISNLPSVLHTINFHKAQGELVEANRGIIEFSDLLKRPLEAFKYLLNTIEKSEINLPSGTAHLDLVLFATTNEKHLDAFKTTPDFSSFKGRFELITVPYLLKASDEEKIYKSDVEHLQKSITIAPHSVRYLCNWAVMTRLKQPDPEAYPKEHRALLGKLDPRTKSRLYEGEELGSQFSPEEQALLQDLRSKIWNESQGMVVYEGRFGASPREVRAIIHRAAQNPKHKTLTPMAIFDELHHIIRDRTVYEFLQFEPRGKYHDANLFIKYIEEDFAKTFENEIVQAMTLVEEGEYDNLLKRYVDNVVAQIKKEKIWDPGTSSFVEPSETFMKDIEKILDVRVTASRHREEMLSRIASFKLENPDKDINVSKIFSEQLNKIKAHFYKEKEMMIESVYKTMLSIGSDHEDQLSNKEKETALEAFDEMKKRFGYDQESAKECLKFLMNYKSRQK